MWVSLKQQLNVLPEMRVSNFVRAYSGQLFGDHAVAKPILAAHHGLYMNLPGYFMVQQQTCSCRSKWSDRASAGQMVHYNYRILL